MKQPVPRGRVPRHRHRPRPCLTHVGPAGYQSASAVELKFPRGRRLVFPRLTAAATWRHGRQRGLVGMPHASSTSLSTIRPTVWKERGSRASCTLITAARIERTVEGLAQRQGRSAPRSSMQPCAIQRPRKPNKHQASERIPPFPPTRVTLDKWLSLHAHSYVCPPPW